ncbi:hypothetical protein BIW11_10299 [Tropilaelaps mercedesae]|uniref:MMS19 nucleotide excision repair protein n=1 Tax=Tropilaelaps mercedesae TaxID=418985 RepID=A0A1V9XGA3_9ACAR|nr:hypothetical protein BIW11_10299 [Tropilaelaps mercedesae]
MSSAVLPGFLRLVELETDPQCLQICFDMFRDVVKKIPLGVYVDDMFGYPAGYFPIDFNAPPDRHGGVTRTQLQESLEECFLAHASFAEYVIKLCLEKISSDVHQAQIDALKLLTRAVDQFDSSVSYDSLRSIWPLLRKLHIACREDKQIQEGILRAIVTLARKLGEGKDADMRLESFAEIICKDFESREAFFENSGWRLIAAYAGGSAISANKILPRAFSIITHMMADENQIRSPLLDASCALLQVLISVYKPVNAIKIPKTYIGVMTVPLIEVLIEQACNLLLDSACETYRVKLLTLIEFALPIEDILGESQLKAIQRFIELCVTQHSALSSSSSIKPIASIVLKRFIAACSSCYGHKVSANLHSLAKERRCVWLLAGLIQREDKASNTNNNARDICIELFSIGGAEAFAAIREIVLNFPEETASEVFGKLLSVEELKGHDLQEYEDLLTVLVRIILAHFDVRQVSYGIPVIIHPDTIQSTLASLHCQLLACGSISMTDLPLLQLRVILSNCPRSCLVDPFGAELATTLLRLSETSQERKTSSNEKFNTPLFKYSDSHSAASEAMCITNLLQCLALLANKFEENSKAEHVIISTIPGLFKGESGGGDCPIMLENNDKEAKKQLATCTFRAAYLTKGLLLRGHKNCEEALAAALKTVPRDIDAAKNFAVLARPEPKIFPREGYCTLRFLCPQRLLTFAIPRLVEHFNYGSDLGRCSYLLTRYLEPVFLWCLSQSSLPTESSRGIVQCLRRSFSQLKFNLGSVLPALLRWSQRPASMDLRIEAMSCVLHLRSHFEIHELLPYKKCVLREMPVGDRKRLIRKAASTTALVWHMVRET